MTVCCPGWIGTLVLLYNNHIEMHGQQNIKKSNRVVSVYVFMKKNKKEKNRSLLSYFTKVGYLFIVAITSNF
jgi:hypothetical protein